MSAVQDPILCCHPERRRRCDAGVEGSAVLVLRHFPSPYSASAALYDLPVLSRSNPGTKSKLPPLPAFKPQEPIRVQLLNGMVIFLQEDHELPLIDATARIRGGWIFRAPTKTGLTIGTAKSGAPAAPRRRRAIRWTTFWKRAPTVETITSRTRQRSRSTA